MKLLVYLFGFALAGLASGSGVTIGLHPELHPIQSLYHSQDWRGQYTYGYATPMITRNEVRNMDGTTVGGYSYMDSNGVLQTVQYKSDPIHGFQVAASNLPQDLPDVAEAKAKHLALFRTIQENNIAAAVSQDNSNLPQDLPEVAAAKAKHLSLFRTIQENHMAGAAAQNNLLQPVQELPEVVAARQAHMAALEAARVGIMPQPVQDTPEVVRARAEFLSFFEATRARDEALRRAISLSPIPQDISGPVSLPNQSSATNQAAPVDYRPAANVAQYGSEGGLGIYSYGYTGPLSSGTEAKTSDGITRGGYSYIDANGILQTVRYIADDVNGFRVQATNIPINPLISNVQTHQMPQDQPASQPASSASHGEGVVSSNRGGFLINVDDSQQNNQNSILYRQEVQY